MLQHRCNNGLGQTVWKIALKLPIHTNQDRFTLSNLHHVELFSIVTKASRNVGKVAEFQKLKGGTIPGIKANLTSSDIKDCW